MKVMIKVREVVPSTYNTVSYTEFEIEANSPVDDADLLKAAAGWLERHPDRTLLSLQLNHCGEDAQKTLLRIFTEG